MSLVIFKQQTADVFTSGHFRPKFESFINKLSIINIYVSTWGEEGGIEYMEKIKIFDCISAEIIAVYL